MLTFREITLEDKELIERYTKRKIPLSYYNFTNLFIWRKVSNTQICEKNGFLIIIGRYKEYNYCYFPLGEGDLKKTLDEILTFFGGNIDFFPLGLDMKDKIEAALGIGFETQESRDQFDYVYERELLATLPGKKYHGKRNHVSKFQKTYTYRFIPIDDRLIGECMELTDKWWENQGGEGRFAEKEVIKEAFRHYHELNLRGGVICVEGNLVAFSVGEMMTHDTALIHLEKADIEYEGSFSVINQEFIKNAFEDAVYVDREEDMGIEGLRKSKLSYHPTQLVPVYRVIVKKS